MSEFVYKFKPVAKKTRTSIHFIFINNMFVFLTLVGMQACQSYQACPICLHSWSPGAVIRRTQCVYDGSRCFLAPGSRARQRTFRHKGHRYEYRCVETRPKPKYRDDEFVKSAVALATTAQPFCGHKPVAPLLAKWPEWSWRRTSTPEPMHGPLRRGG